MMFRSPKLLAAAKDAPVCFGCQATNIGQVVVSLFQPTKRKCDIDNYMKALLDALQHAGCYDDDEQIDELHIVRMGVFKGGECRVVVNQL